jgi:multiple sugar transport system permease protein
MSAAQNGAIPRPYAAVRPRGPTRARILQTVATYLVLGAGGVGLLVPFAWMLRTSLMSADQIFAWPLQWIPNPVVWQNYPAALTAEPFGLFTLNTIFLTAFCIVGSLAGNTLAAYGFARLRFPWRQTLFLVMLSTMMLPYTVTMIPTFVLFKYLGWINTFLPLIVPAFFTSPFYTFLLRQFFLSIPVELEEAARIDGCGTLGIFLRIAIPLSTPAVATVAIMSFMSNWNNFLGPLIYLQTQNNFVLSLGVRMFQQKYFTNYTLLMAAATAAMLPCLVLFFFAQRLFIQGIVITGVKG